MAEKQDLPPKPNGSAKRAGERKRKGGEGVYSGRQQRRINGKTLTLGLFGPGRRTGWVGLGRWVCHRWEKRKKRGGKGGFQIPLKGGGGEAFKGRWEGKGGKKRPNGPKKKFFLLGPVDRDLPSQDVFSITICCNTLWNNIG